MTEIPEHLRKRAEEARKKAAGKGDAAPAAQASGDAPAPAEGAAAQPAAGGSDKIPSHLLERSKAAKAGGTATAAPAAAAPAVAAAGGGANPTGPGGHTQRLLTVVKSGSIQDVKATPVDKVHTWPHLLVIEFVAALAITAFTLIFSIFVNAPLLELANSNQTPNPSKAPWYFLGLQELLTLFHPMVAGVTIPTIALVLFAFAPFIDKNPSNKPEDRKFAVALWTVSLMFWGILVIIGSFFRGPGFNFTLPWSDGMWFEL